MINAKQIRALRDQRGWTQAELAKRLGITSSAVGQWEIGETRPSMAKLQALARVLDRPLAELIGEDDADRAMRSGPAISLRLDDALLKEAADLDIDTEEALSSHLMDLIRKKRAERWLEENREALVSANGFLDRHGLWSDGKRLF